MTVQGQFIAALLRVFVLGCLIVRESFFPGLLMAQQSKPMEITKSDIAGVERIVAVKPILFLGMRWTNDKGHWWHDVIDGTMTGREVAAANQEIFVSPRANWSDRGKIVAPSEIWKGEIDFVLFSDGSRFGPDTFRNYEGLLLRSQTAIELADGVMTGRLTATDLERIASESGAMTEYDFRAMWRPRIAKGLAMSSRIAERNPGAASSHAAAALKQKHEQILRVITTGKQEVK